MQRKGKKKEKTLNDSDDLHNFQIYFDKFNKISQEINSIINLRISIIDSNNKLLFTTKNSEEIIGYSYEDFNLLATYGYIHPDDRPKVISTFNLANNLQSSPAITYRIFRPEGSMKWIRGIAQKIVDNKSQKIFGLLIVEYDISNDIQQMNLTDLSKDNFYRSLIELIQTPILFMKNNTIDWVTKNWEDFFGYQESEFRGNTIEFLFKEKNDYANLLLQFNQKLKLKGSLNFNAFLQKKDNSIFSCNIIAYSINKNNLAEGILFFFIDVTVDRTTQKKKDEYINTHQSILSNIESIVIYVQNQKIIGANEIVQNFILYKNTELIDKDLNILFQTKEQYKEFLVELNKSFMLNKNFVGEITCIRKDRLPVIFSARAILIKLENKFEYILLLEPINELKQLINTLRNEKSELEFYSDTLFHDVKNLCQDALGYIDLSLLKMDTNPNESILKQRKSIIEILKISELITNMEKYFKIKRKGYELFSYDIFSGIEKAIEKIRTKFETKEIIITHNIKPKKYITSSNELLEDAFFNILDNAVMFDRHDVVKIEVKVSESNEYPNYWRLEFIDNGPGIGDELKKYLFDRFARSKGTIHGSGFGLTLVKAIIDGMNGYVSVINKDDKDISKGSILIIEIPKEQ